MLGGGEVWNHMYRRVNYWGGGKAHGILMGPTAYLKKGGGGMQKVGE